MKQFADLASSGLDGAINDTDVTLNLSSPGAFPSTGPFDILIDSELITVGSRSGAACSELIRGVGGTAAASHSSGAGVRHVVTAAALRALRATTKRKTATETVNNSAAYQDDDHLSFDIGANEVWVFEFVLFIQGSTSADFKCTLTVPSGATLMSGVHGLATTVSSATGSIYTFAGVGDHQSIGAPGPSSPAVLSFRGIVVNGANAGTCVLQWAQQAATLADTQVLVNSFLIAHEAQA
jgi:hypothetical protein